MRLPAPPPATRTPAGKPACAPSRPAPARAARPQTASAKSPAPPRGATLRRREDGATVKKGCGSKRGEGRGGGGLGGYLAVVVLESWWRRAGGGANGRIGGREWREEGREVVFVARWPSHHLSAIRGEVSGPRTTDRCTRKWGRRGRGRGRGREKRRPRRERAGGVKILVFSAQPLSHSASPQKRE